MGTWGLYDNESDAALDYKGEIIDNFVKKNNKNLFEVYDKNIKEINKITNKYKLPFTEKDLQSKDFRKLVKLKVQFADINMQIHKYISKNKIKLAKEVKSTLKKYNKFFKSIRGQIGLIIEISNIGRADVYETLTFPEININQIKQNKFTTINYNPPKLFNGFPESLRKYVCDLILNEKKLMEIGKSGEHQYEDYDRQAKIEALNNELKYFGYYNK